MSLFQFHQNPTTNPKISSVLHQFGIRAKFLLFYSSTKKFPLHKNPSFHNKSPKREKRKKKKSCSVNNNQLITVHLPHDQLTTTASLSNHPLHRRSTPWPYCDLLRQLRLHHRLHHHHPSHRRPLTTATFAEPPPPAISPPSPTSSSPSSSIFIFLICYNLLRRRPRTDLHH